MMDPHRPLNNPSCSTVHSEHNQNCIRPRSARATWPYNPMGRSQDSTLSACQVTPRPYDSHARSAHLILPYNPHTSQRPQVPAHTTPTNLACRIYSDPPQSTSYMPSALCRSHTLSPEQPFLDNSLSYKSLNSRNTSGICVPGRPHFFYNSATPNLSLFSPPEPNPDLFKQAQIVDLNFSSAENDLYSGSLGHEITAWKIGLTSWINTALKAYFKKELDIGSGIVITREGTQLSKNFMYDSGPARFELDIGSQGFVAKTKLRALCLSSKSWCLTVGVHNTLKPGYDFHFGSEQSYLEGGAYGLHVGVEFTPQFQKLSEERFSTDAATMTKTLEKIDVESWRKATEHVLQSWGRPDLAVTTDALKEALKSRPYEFLTIFGGNMYPARATGETEFVVHTKLHQASITIRPEQINFWLQQAVYQWQQGHGQMKAEEAKQRFIDASIQTYLENRIDDLFYPNMPRFVQAQTQKKADEIFAGPYASQEQLLKAQILSSAFTFETQPIITHWAQQSPVSFIHRRDVGDVHQIIEKVSEGRVKGFLSQQFHTGNSSAIVKQIEHQTQAEIHALLQQEWIPISQLHHVADTSHPYFQAESMIDKTDDNNRLVRAAANTVLTGAIADHKDSPGKVALSPQQMLWLGQCLKTDHNKLITTLNPLEKNGMLWVDLAELNHNNTSAQCVGKHGIFAEKSSAITSQAAPRTS